MERQDGFSGYPNKPARTTTALTTNPGQDSAANINITTIPNEKQQQLPQTLPPPGPPSIIREQDQYMPIANVIRIMRRIIPPHAKISDDAKETVQECVSEFISFVTGEANERCRHEQRKTITAEDVIWAMGKLGFDNYVEPLSLLLNRYRENENERSSIHREPVPMPRRGPAVNHALLGIPPGPSGDVFNMGPQHGLYYPSFGGFLEEGSGSASGSSSQDKNNMPGFDPFDQFK